jgi:hypothetical protein
MASCSCCVYCSLIGGSTAGVAMCGGNQTATPPPTYATTSSCTEVFKYYTTKTPEFYTQLTLPRATTLKPWSITLPWVTTPSRRWSATWLRMLPILLHRGSQVLLCSQLLIAPIFLSTTLFSAATPRLPLITPPKRQSTSLPWSTQPQLRRTSITQSRVATQKQPFRATLNRNTTLMVQSTTPRPTLHLATTRQPPSTTPKKPPITQLRTLPSLLHRGI